MLGKTHTQRENEEGTRDAIFLLQERAPTGNERGDSYWVTHSVWLDRGEAEGYAKRRDYHFGPLGERVRVYSVPASGALAALLRLQDTVDLEARGLIEGHAGKDFSLILDDPAPVPA